MADVQVFVKLSEAFKGLRKRQFKAFTFFCGSFRAYRLFNFIQCDPPMSITKVNIAFGTKISLAINKLGWETWDK